jgi:lipopolysaccharide transport system ATP-binding protein
MGSIVVSNLGKAYKQYPSRWARLAEWISPSHQRRHRLHWVLQDIDFSLNPGEAVGLIGINGAGKSTLLKMITGTTLPTTGSVHITGRVSALLELGMGFHPDFTGRQNSFMAGQLLGYSVEEIARLMPGIEAFAEIGDYIDQPVRVYSSGMQVRLAFAVATAHRPDVLIIDEALSVGDVAFQRKCFQRIENYQTLGSTLLLVSHDIETVKKLCDRALFIKDGQLAHFGAAKRVCDEYEKYLFGDRLEQTKPAQDSDASSPVPETSKLDPSLVASCEMSYGNGKADIETCWLEDVNGRRINVVEAGTPFRWCYRVRFNQDVDKPIFAMMLKTREGIALYGVDSTLLGNAPSKARVGELLDVTFDLANVLAPGVYYLNCGVRIHNASDVEFLCRRVDSEIMRVTASPISTVSTGVVEMGARLSIHQSAATDA